jgi:hypothetical protein
MPCPIKAATATSGSSGFCGWKSITVHWNTLCLGILIHSINPHAISAILVPRNFLVHISQWKPWDPLQGWYILLSQDMSTKSQKPRDPFTPVKASCSTRGNGDKMVRQLLPGAPNFTLSIPTPQSCQIRGYWSHLPLWGLKHMTVQGERISPTTTFLFLYFWMITAIDWRIDQIT